MYGRDEPMGAWARVIDLLIAVVLIALALPLMVIVAVAIKLDSPGPALSKREQWGGQGYRYQLFRFEPRAIPKGHGSRITLPRLELARFFAGCASTACRSSLMCCAET